MSWCRANIGVGADVPLPPEEVAKDIRQLPFSLSEPVLSRLSSTSSKDKGFLPGLGSAMSNYLLKLLDSPAYSNLTPAYLANHFNPLTPDRDDIQYFSIAARAPSMGPWHPLWLPKLILDAADAKRAQSLGYPKSEGNDGLVAIESAKWGKFLGVVDNCDHWELRGAAGLRRPIEAAKQAEEKLTKEAISARSGEDASSQAGLTAIYEKIGQLQAERQDDSRPGKSDSSSASKIASWITKRIPFTQTQEPKAPSRPVGIPADQDAPLRFTTKKNPQPGRFNLEGLYVALTRQLYESGL
jgi:triacylglycerol lipase